MPEPVIWDGREASLDSARHEFHILSPQTKLKMPWPWSGTMKLSQWNPIPLKFRSSNRKMRRKEKSPKSIPQSVTSLQRSFEPHDGLWLLYQRKWSWYDLQHLLVACFVIFSLSIAPMPWLARIGVVVGYSVLLLMPATRQFFLPSLPIWTYLLYFFTSRYVELLPSSYPP